MRTGCRCLVSILTGIIAVVAILRNQYGLGPVAGLIAIVPAVCRCRASTSKQGAALQVQLQGLYSKIACGRRAAEGNEPYVY